MVVTPYVIGLALGNENKSRSEVVLWMLRNILSNSHPSHSSCIPLRKVCTHLVICRIRRFISWGRAVVNIGRTNTRNKNPNLACGVGRGGWSNNIMSNPYSSLREVCTSPKMVQDPEYPMYWDGPMRVSYIIFNDRRSESITGKHIYQQSRIVCEDITKPSSPRRRPIQIGSRW